MLCCLVLASHAMNEGFVPESHSFNCDDTEELHTGTSDKAFLRASRAVLPRSGAGVAVITIDPNMSLSVSENVCASRAFFTALIPAVARLHPAVIAIDKTYSENACDDHAINDAFRAALLHTPMPIVLGMPTHLPSEEQQRSARSCLVQSPGLRFAAGQSDAPVFAHHVYASPTQVDSDPLQIPLAWRVIRAGQGEQTQPKAILLDTLPLQAAELARPELRTDPTLLKLKRESYDPFAKLLRRGVLPRVGALALLCAGSEHATVASHNWGICPGASVSPPDLVGKVAVIGDLKDTDKHTLPEGEIYGVFLQAQYIEALLDRAYWRHWDPNWERYGLLAFLTFDTFGVWYLAPKSKRKAFGFASACALALVSFCFVAMRLGYFLPWLWYALLGVGSAVVALPLEFGLEKSLERSEMARHPDRVTANEHHPQHTKER